MSEVQDSSSQVASHQSIITNGNTHSGNTDYCPQQSLPVGIQGRSEYHPANESENDGGESDGDDEDEDEDNNLGTHIETTELLFFLSISSEEDVGSGGSEPSNQPCWDFNRSHRRPYPIPLPRGVMGPGERVMAVSRISSSSSSAKTIGSVQTASAEGSSVGWDDEATLVDVGAALVVAVDDRSPLTRWFEAFFWGGVEYLLALWEVVRR